jgi:tRNA (mo5U34)-methyltransferase
LVKPLVHRLTRRDRSQGPPSPSANGHLPSAAAAVPALQRDPESAALEARVAGIDWYHTIDLGHGVVTRGKVDHRPQLALYQLPESLAGMRCLDVATMDGFWAYEMERRGAAEVVGIDVARRIDVDLPYGVREELVRTGQDGPASGGFGLAHEVLGSKVKKVSISVYDLSPEVVGEFDFIFLSDLLLHIRDPQLALEKVRSVCRGVLHIADVCDTELDSFGDLCLAEYPLYVTGKYYWWWRMNVSTIRRMLAVAGFESVVELSRLRLNLTRVQQAHLPAKIVLQARVPGAR